MHTKNSFNGTVVEGIDFETGIKRLGGKEEIYLKILKSYVANVPNYLEKLNGFISSEDTKNDYIIVVHGIKGSSYNICADEVGKMAEALEMAGKNGDWDSVNANHAAFVKVAESLVCELAKLIELNS